MASIRVLRTYRLTSCKTGIYHHVTGVDASSSASLAAYINTLTYTEHGQPQSAKIVEGIYWYERGPAPRLSFSLL